MNRLDIILHKHLDGIREELDAYLEENSIVADKKNIIGSFLESLICLNSDEDDYDDYDDEMDR